VFCLILNAGSIGGIETHLTKQVSVSDELADAFIVNRSLFSIGALASFAFDIGAFRCVSLASAGDSGGSLSTSAIKSLSSPAQTSSVFL